MAKGPALTQDQNILPVQALFDLQNNFVTFIGQGQPFTVPLSGVITNATITNSTIDSTTIGATTPSTGVFTNISTTTGSITATPVNSTDIANKLYVDTVALGISWKEPAQAATMSNITLSGLQTVDGVALQAGNIVLVKNQSNAAQNGIYVASSGAWSYAPGSTTWSEYVGALIFVDGGSQAGSLWYNLAQPGGTLGTTAMTWSNFSTSAVYTAGTGLTLTGTQFSISNTGVTAGTYTNANITVNAQGQITVASNGTQGGVSSFKTTLSGLTPSTATTGDITLAGTLGVPSGGTGVTNLIGIAYGNGTGSFTAATGSQIASAIGTTFITNATNATYATNLTGGATYSIPYQSAGSTTSFLAAGTGVLQSNSGLSYTTTPTLQGTNFSNIPNSALNNSSITIGSTTISLGGTATSVSGLNLVTPTVTSYETFTAISAPSYAEGRIWYDSTNHTLAQYNDVTNNTVHLGEEIQLKVYNNTGSTINVGQPVYVTSTSTGYTYPNVALAIANSLTTANVIGLANQAIPTGTAGYVTTIGLVQGVNTGSYTVGDTLYLSPYSAGYYQNTIPPTGYAVKLGTVAYVNSSNGAIYVNKSNLSVQAGNIVGQVALANGGTNANLSASAGSVAYSTSSAINFTSVGSAGQYLQSNGTGAPTWTTVSAGLTITDDTSSTTTYYPAMTTATTGTISGEYTSSTKLSYKPSTGTLSVANLALANPLGYASGGTGLSSVGSSGQILTSTGSGLTYSNRTQYLGVLLNGGSTTQVPTSNGYIGVLLNGGSTTQVPIS